MKDKIKAAVKAVKENKSTVRRKAFIVMGAGAGMLIAGVVSHHAPTTEQLAGVLKTALTD